MSNRSTATPIVTDDKLAEVPAALKARPQWVVWKYESRKPGGPRTKIPYTVTGKRASSTDPATWAAFDDAYAVWVKGSRYAGVGYVFSADDPYTGIDLDKSLSDDGQLLTWARVLFDSSLTYGEVSPSGTGVKFIAEASIDGDGVNRKGFGPDKTGGVELYDCGRFFTITGRRFADSPREVRPCAKFVAGLYAIARKANRSTAAAATPVNGRSTDNRVARCMKYLERCPDAVSGSGGHNATLHAAAVCFRFGLDDADARNAMAWFNTNKTAGEPWSERELQHKLDDARKKVGGEFGCMLVDERRDGRTTSARSTPKVATRDDGSIQPAEPWRDPLPLPAGLPPVMPFDFALLPDALCAWVIDISDRMQCPPDYCAATAMVVAGALIGRKVAIRPKQHDDWQVVPNLFGAMVGRPAQLKTPAMKEVTKYLARLEVEAKAEHAKAMSEFELAAIVADATKKMQKAAIKEAVKSGGDAHAIVEQMAGEAAEAPPTRKRYLANDVTVEKLGVILSENPNGVLIYVDELVSLLRVMDREGHESDRGFYLTAWAGDSRYTYDRIGRGTIDVEAAIVSVVGSIQPGVIADYLRGAVNGGAGDDGLIQRFQMTVWPDAPATWQNIDRYPNPDAKGTAHAALARLAALTPGLVEAERDNFDADAIPFLRFDHFAQVDFDAWRSDLETRLRSGDEHPAIESHLAKYRSLVPSLALIVHLFDGGVGPVTASALGKAIGWGRYLESHARRLYAGVTEAPAMAARMLAMRIQAGELPDLFAHRDIYRNCWAGLDKERSEAAIDVLLSLHWIEERVEATGGRARTRYAINPNIVIRKPTAAAVDDVDDYERAEREAVQQPGM